MKNKEIMKKIEKKKLVRTFTTHIVENSFGLNIDSFGLLFQFYLSHFRLKILSFCL